MSSADARRPAHPALRWGLLTATVVTLVAVAAALGQEVLDYAGWVRLAVGLGVGGAVLAAATVWAWGPRRLPAGAWVLLIAGFVLPRVAALPAQRYLSDDAHRYSWDGKVTVHGINPYLYPPNAPALDALRGDRTDALVNHPDRPTVYPPLAQAVFALGYLLSPGRLVGLQLLFLLAEALTLVILAAALAPLLGVPPARLLLMAAAPLLVLEGYLPGHVDLLALPCVAALVLSLRRGWVARAGLALGLATLVKPFAILFVPALLVHFAHKRSLQALGVCVAVVALGYLPFASAGLRLFESTAAMAGFWSFNGALGGLLEALLPRAVARGVAGVALAAGVCWGAWRTRGRPEAGMLAAWAALALCSPVVFPWYLVWMLPLLVLVPDPALLALVALAPLAELVGVHYFSEGLWALPGWVPWVEYGTCALLLGLGWRRRWGIFAPARASTLAERSASSASLADAT